MKKERTLGQMRKPLLMASSMKSKQEEKEKEKKKERSSSAGKIAKAQKTQDKKTAASKKSSKLKQKSDNKTSRRRNGSVDESEVLVDPASSTESEESEPEREEERRSKTKNPKPKKRKQKEGDEEEDDYEQKEEAKLCRFPMNRIKRLIKSGDCNKGTTQDAIFLVNKATEKFLEQFCEDAYQFTVKDRKKSLGYKHLASVVCKQKRYDFLSDFVPEKVKAEDALKEKKLSETKVG